jgi:hypothetical protein
MAEGATAGGHTYACIQMEMHYEQALFVPQSVCQGQSRPQATRWAAKQLLANLPREAKQSVFTGIPRKRAFPNGDTVHTRSSPHIHIVPSQRPSALKGLFALLLELSSRKEVKIILLFGEHE